MLFKSDSDISSDFREKEKTVAIFCHMYSDTSPTREKAQSKMKFKTSTVE
jgi:hypothetical protein